VEPVQGWQIEKSSPDRKNSAEYPEKRRILESACLPNPPPAKKKTSVREFPMAGDTRDGKSQSRTIRER
jgi:hypothetical protein